MRSRLTILLLVGFLPSLSGDGRIITISHGLDTRCYVQSSSRYKIDEGEFRPISGLFSYFNGRQNPLIPFIACESGAVRGGVYRVHIADQDGIDWLKVSITDSAERPVSDTEGVLYTRDDEQGVAIWVALLGIPNWIGDGTYNLVVEGGTGSRYFRFLESISMEITPYELVEIPLTPDLTDLHTKPDPEKDRQSRVLTALLLSFRRDALHHRTSMTIPVSAEFVSSRYGQRRKYIYSDGNTSLRVHHGIDLAAFQGTPIHAAGRGEVVMSEARIITGNTIVIEHFPGVFSLYYHLEKLLVSVGSRVEKRQVIGTVGSTGLSTGPHLHWEVRVSGVAVDPNVFIESELVDYKAIVGILKLYSLR